MTDRFTPGPWHLIPSKHKDHAGAVVRIQREHEMRDDFDIARIAYGWKHRHEEAEANARLIATAPEMYEVLELICDLSSQEWEEGGKRKAATDNTGNRLWFTSDDVMKHARAILAKVKK